MAILIWNQCASKRIPRLSGFILAAWVSCCVPGSSGQVSITPDVPVARVGQTVTLYINLTGSALSAVWHKGASSVSEANRILSYSFVANTTQIGPWNHHGKEAALPDGSLRITGVWRNHTGPYTVRILLTDAVTHREASTEIGVYDVLAPPTLVHTSGSGFSGDDFKLDCQVGDQTVERYAFFKDTMNVTCDQKRIHCSENSSVLSFQPLQESESGNYTCTIYNPVSHNSSLPLGIRVKAPISNVTITSNMPSGRLWENEDSVQLNCTAKGTDPVFSWMLNGSALPQVSRYNLSANNSSLTISPVTRGDNGSFHCIASNSANNESSVPLNLTISWRPNGQMICGATNISDGIQFSCSWPGGNPAASVQMVLPPIVNKSSDSEVSHNTSQSDITTNMTLSCNGIQETRTSLCSLNLGLPHYPNFQNNTSSNPTEGEPHSLIVNLGQSSSTRVTSVQILPATFAWSHGSSSIPESDDKLVIDSNTTFSTLTINKVTVNNSGDYHCLVQNLMGSTTFSFLVNVQPAPETTTPTTTTTITPNGSPGSGGLSAGAIAGIVIGAVALVVIIGVTVFCVLKNKKGKNYGSNSSSEGTGSKQGDPNAMPMNDSSRNGDINYAVFNFNQTQQATPPADYPGASEMLVYAQVKKN